MSLPRPQFRIWWLMAGVAVVAMLLAWVHVDAVVAMAGMLLVVILPALLAPATRRLEAAAWAASLQPPVPLVYLYATWVVAWCVLGHRPRVYLNDPKYLGEIVAILRCMFFVAFLPGSAICLGTGLVLTVVCSARRSVHWPLVVLPLAWLAAFVLFRWDPLGVSEWLFD
jgi:hypothetical protein